MKLILRKWQTYQKPKAESYLPKVTWQQLQKEGGQENDTALLRDERTIDATSPTVESVPKRGKNTGTKPKSFFNSFTCRAGHSVNMKNQPGVGIGVTKCSCGEVVDIEYGKSKIQVIKQWYEPKVEPKKDKIDKGDKIKTKSSKGTIEEEMLARRNFCLSKMEEHRKRSAIQEDNKGNLVGTKRISEPASSMQENWDHFKKPLTETKVEPTSDTADSAVGEITTGITTMHRLEGSIRISFFGKEARKPSQKDREEGAGLLCPGQITNLGPPNLEAGTLMVCRNSDLDQPYFPWDASGNLKTAVRCQPSQNFDQK